MFITGEHHAAIDHALGQLERGELTDTEGRPSNVLIITLPPRFGKTQFCVIDWMARSLARNPRAKFIHLSYSDDLALDNSAKCRETVTSLEYQSFWPVAIKGDADSKKKWYTEEGGGVYATAAGGAVTGFGAGSLADVKQQIEDEDASAVELGSLIDNFFSEHDEDIIDPTLFYGAIVIDDPIKVDDADNEKERNRVNKRVNSTIKSRRNSRNTPLVVIMQRLNDEDMAGFILSGGMDEPVHHLNLPAILNYGTPEARSLWPAKHTLEELYKMKTADHSVFMAQYMQDPTPQEGTFFKTEWFSNRRFRLGQEPTRLVKYGAGDYAVKEDEDADATEQAIGGFDVNDNLYLLDWHTGHVTIDKSISKMVDMMITYDPMLWAGEAGVIRRAMEPYITKEKQLRRVFVKNEWLPATASKAVNAKAFQGLCSAGKVYIPYGQWGDDLIAQLLKFTGKDDKEDDKVDVCGLFGRLLGLTFGPAQYHETLEGSIKDGYDIDDDNDTTYGNGSIPIV